MVPDELDVQLDELETRVERLRSLYEQYFLGIEKIEPLVARKDVDRRIWILRREKIRNTGKRFRLQGIIQRYNTFQQYWMRICREIENGTYHRHVARAAKILGDQQLLTIATRRRFRRHRSTEEAVDEPAPSPELVEASPTPDSASVSATADPPPPAMTGAATRRRRPSASPHPTPPALEHLSLAKGMAGNHASESLDPLEETRRLMDEALGESDVPPARPTVRRPSVPRPNLPRPAAASITAAAEQGVAPIRSATVSGAQTPNLQVNPPALAANAWLAAPSRAELAPPRLPRTGAPEAGPASLPRGGPSASAASPPSSRRFAGSASASTHPKSVRGPSPPPGQAPPASVPVGSAAGTRGEFTHPQNSRIPTAHLSGAEDHPAAHASPTHALRPPSVPRLASSSHTALPPGPASSPDLQRTAPHSAPGTPRATLGAGHTVARPPLGLPGTRAAVGGSVRLGQIFGNVSAARNALTQPSGTATSPNAVAASVQAGPHDVQRQRPTPAPRAAMAPSSSLNENNLRQLHARLLAAKQETREAGAVSLDGLRKTILATETKLRAQHGANRQVDFSVVIKDGKAILKPTVR